MSNAILPSSVRARRPLSMILKGLAISGALLLILRLILSPERTKTSLLRSHPPPLKTFQSEEISNKIWQTWHTPAMFLDEEDKARVRTWHEQNPNHRYELLTDKGGETFVRQHFAGEPLIRDVFLNLTDTILRADFLRYLVLLAEGKLLLWRWSKTLIASLGGIYADLDVECRKPIDTWTPDALKGRAGVVVGIEADRKPVKNDVELYYDYREYIWGIANWTFMAKRGHPFMQFVAETVAMNLLKVAKKQQRSLSTMELSYKEVIDATGPRAFTEAFFAYASRATGSPVSYETATMLEEPKLIDDILLLPIRAMSTAEADRTGVMGAHSSTWPAVIFHWSAGTWKKTHFQRPEP